MKSVSIDFGGTTIKLAIVEDGRVLARSRLPAFSGEGLKERLPDLEKRIRELTDLRTLDGIGIAIPGIVDHKAKRVLSVNGKYTDAVGMDLNAWCKKAFGLEMILENDANAALAGELSYGAGKGYGDAVIMILGTGVGTAAAIGGRLLRSRHHQPYWVHATVSADPGEPLTFGAWCDRDYGFEYDEVRAHGGLAYFPLIGESGELKWQRNTRYKDSELIQKAPQGYSNLEIREGVPIYTQFEQNPDTFLFVSYPVRKKEVWAHFVP